MVPSSLHFFVCGSIYNGSYRHLVLTAVFHGDAKPTSSLWLLGPNEKRTFLGYLLDAHTPGSIALLFHWLPILFSSLKSSMES